MRLAGHLVYMLHETSTDSGQLSKEEKRDAQDYR
jgi:hypothetical protein